MTGSDNAQSPQQPPEQSPEHKRKLISMEIERRDQRESDLPIGLAKPARRALIEAGYCRLEQFTELSEAEVQQLHGIGPKALDQIRRALSTNGLSFADKERT
jgi:hypothetical protein